MNKKPIKQNPTLMKLLSNCDDKSRKYIISENPQIFNVDTPSLDDLNHLFWFMLHHIYSHCAPLIHRGDIQYDIYSTISKSEYQQIPKKFRGIYRLNKNTDTYYLNKPNNPFLWDIAVAVNKQNYTHYLQQYNKLRAATSYKDHEYGNTIDAYSAILELNKISRVIRMPKATMTTYIKSPIMQILNEYNTEMNMQNRILQTSLQIKKKRERIARLNAQVNNLYKSVKLSNIK